MTIRLAVVCILLVLFPAAAFAEQSDDLYGAIAYSKRTKRWGLATGESSRNDAQYNALAYCRSRDCSVMVWFRNSCAVLATGNNGQATGWAYDSTTRRARKRALEECAKYADDCSVVVMGCADDE